MRDAFIERRNPREATLVVASLGGLATTVAALGIFGLVAFTVAQRTREIGIRMALGARSADILRTVLAQYAAPVIAGMSAGLAIAAAAYGIVRSVLAGIVALDPLSCAAAVLLFALIALAGSLLPARRALRIEPASALRHE
jgi:putative ABC transport system permease protein